MNPISNCFIECNKNFDDSEIVIIGIPYDGTSSYRPGSRFAPDEIRKASYGLETFSPIQNKDLLDKNICDIGDLELSFGNKLDILKKIEIEIDKIIHQNKKILSIGGEHLITYPIIKSYLKKYPDLFLIHFDAHADLRDDYLGENLSHATVIRRISELIGLNRIFQYGIRSGTKEEFDIIRNNNLLNRDLNKVKNIIGDTPVYITVDLDILDPSVFPGTGTPEPGGISFNSLINKLHILSELNIVGCDVVELAPDYDPSKVSTIVAAKIIRELLIFI
ncbi:agmatinase [Deferribacter autotrophicus]|uniref:Agmatinase n=1 Tax=Deferribacter autotrophicus TaxID=500465 RepID=A0A5A8F5Z4_9BACT|nr:agmatinase [Deferribacter autotrophicus]KAA0259564.1 agmatinase [Deferribacter autotrophicus]